MIRSIAMSRDDNVAAIESTRNGMSSLTSAEPHAATLLTRGDRLQRDRDGSRRTVLRGGGEEGDGIVPCALVEALQLPGERVLGQPGGKRIQQRFRRF